MTRALAWIDLETTGLLIQSDKILQVCCIITNSNLDIISPIFNKTIQSDLPTLRAMAPYVRRMHLKTQLYPKTLQSQLKIEQADIQLREFIDKYVPKQVTLAGSSVHFDKRFIDKYMPATSSKLQHRILDVSSINEFGLRHNPELMLQKPKKKHLHDAKSDILESIEELRWYRDNYFKNA